MDSLDRYYEILGLEPGTSQEDVKRAYRDMAKVWHPDRFPNDPRLQQKAEAKLRDINEAYERVRSGRPSPRSATNRARPANQEQKAKGDSSDTPKASQSEAHHSSSTRASGSAANQSDPSSPTPQSTAPNAQAVSNLRTNWRWLVLGAVVSITLAALALREDNKKAPGPNTAAQQAPKPSTPVLNPAPAASVGVVTNDPPDARSEPPTLSHFEMVESTLEYLRENAASEAELVRTYGRENVQTKNIHIAEGDFESGTVLFAKDRANSVEILWKDSTRREIPKRIQISGDKSAWATRQGITLGTTLKELEQMNGRPFVLFGFGWDYAGSVLSWKGGRLEQQLSVNGKMILALDGQKGKKVSQEESDSVEGDAEYLSSNRVMQKKDPRVYQIIWLKDSDSAQVSAKASPAPAVPAPQITNQAAALVPSPSPKRASSIGVTGNYFTVGSTKNKVLEVQGTPDSFTPKEFRYGVSHVYFNGDYVVGWDNNFPKLRALLAPSIVGSRDYFTVGSSKDEVLSVQGTPDSFTEREFRYGVSHVYFSGDRVMSWDNNFPKLKAKLVTSSTTTSRQYFTVGSTKEEVILIQGTPDSFSENEFRYGVSHVHFQNGRVISWDNNFPKLRVQMSGRE